MTPSKPMLCQDGKGREFPTDPRWVMEAKEDGWRFLWRAVGAALAVGIVLTGAQGAAARSDHHGHHGDQTALGLHWYDLTNEAVAASGQPEQSTQNRIWAVSWIAAARAVDDHDDPAYRTAAFATALHDTLVSLAPAQTAELDDELAQTLATVRDWRAKDKGIAAGRHEAARSLAERSGDGLETAAEVDPPYTPPAAAPGIWQPTPPAFGPAVRAGIPELAASCCTPTTSSARRRRRGSAPSGTCAPSRRSTRWGARRGAPGPRSRPRWRTSSPSPRSPSMRRYCAPRSPTHTTHSPGRRGSSPRSTRSRSISRSRSTTRSTRTCGGGP